MTKPVSYRTLKALLTSEDDAVELRAVESLPTLNERVEMFLRGVHGSRREFSAGERAVARVRILDAMANDLSERINELGRPVDPIPVVANVRSDVANARPTRQRNTWTERVTRLIEPLLFPLILATGPRARYVTASLAALLVAGGSCIGAWIYSARAAESTIAQWIDREVHAGRAYECGSRSIGGFPLRVDMRCIEPSMKITSDQTNITADAKEIRVVASILRPEGMSVDITGPVSVSERGQPTFLANWASAHLRLQGRPTAPEDVSIAFDAPQFYRVSQTGMLPLLTGDKIEVEMRPSTNGRIEILGRVIGGFTPLVAPLALQPFMADVVADASDTIDSGGTNFGTLLREWQSNGGKIELKTAHIQQGDAVADAEGYVGLNGQGLVDGSIRVTTSGAYLRFAESLMRPGQGDADHARIAQSFEPGMQKQTRSLGQPAGNTPARNAPLAPSYAPLAQSGSSSEIPIHIHDGKVYLGTVIIAEIPALY
jgi:hypothetical protein